MLPRKQHSVPTVVLPAKEEAELAPQPVRVCHFHTIRISTLVLTLAALTGHSDPLSFNHRSHLSRHGLKRSMVHLEEQTTMHVSFAYRLSTATIKQRTFKLECQQTTYHRKITCPQTVSEVNPNSVFVSGIPIFISGDTQNLSVFSSNSKLRDTSQTRFFTSV